jgi:hypothetical protein
MAELRRVWQDTTQPGAWDSPVYEEFIVAVRSINTGLPSAKCLRILAYYPFDWAVSAADALLKWDARDEFAA